MSKISARHLERKAFVYVRQSSLQQVSHHRESADRQYRLRERAQRLGWQADEVEVIDEDQGRSGASTENRTGFQRMVSEVALGQVGAIVGLEVSRLARSCADWYRLLEVAALAGTVIVDEEGVYDPNHYNDRLLLGLKGTLSEAELHFLKQRMIGARRNKVRRGEFRIRLPVGYVWEEGEGIRIDPDERVQDVVGLLFRSFDRVGSAAGVARYFEDHRQPFPRRDGWGSLDMAVTWGRLSYGRATEVLKSPIYAGVYVYDRRNPKPEDPEDPCAGGRIWIEDSHPGYLTLEQYERNVARLAANRSQWGGMRTGGSAREGRGLLQGLVLCGVCGRPMQVSYYADGNRIYQCSSPVTRRMCQRVNGRHIDPLVEEEVLGALGQEQLELAVTAFDTLADRAEELKGQWEKRIEAARYEAQKASRRYHQVEPENRLVARTLEREWNDKLHEVESLEEEYGKVLQQLPFEITPEQRERILALAENVPRLWRAPTTRNSQRKELLRLLIEDVTLRNLEEPYSVEVAIRWKTGLATRHRAQRVKRHAWTTPPEVIARIEELYREKIDREIAELLNAEGYRSGYGKYFTESGVAHLRYRHGLMKRNRGEEVRSGTRKTNQGEAHEQDQAKCRSRLSSDSHSKCH